MKLKHLLTPLVFFASVMFATASYAAGEITIINAPATAVQGATVPIQIQGSGSCNSIINYGDGTPNGTTGNSSFPHGYTHAWGTTGTKTITVTTDDDGCTTFPAPLTKTILITAAVPDDPTISSISGSSCAKRGASYSIKVNGSGGSGICATLNVTWGDGESSSYGSHNLTASPWLTHTYANSVMLGSKNINASGCGSELKTITLKTSCLFIPPGAWKYKFKFIIWKIPPWPKCPRCPPCLSCPPWFEKIKWHEAQMKKFGARRNAKMFNMHKAKRAVLIRKVNAKRRGAMKLKRAPMRKAPMKRMHKAPMKRMQMK